MSNDNNVIDPSFFKRVLSNDSFRRGIGTAVAGVLVATVVELVWPSSGS